MRGITTRNGALLGQQRLAVQLVAEKDVGAVRLAQREAVRVHAVTRVEDDRRGLCWSAARRSSNTPMGTPTQWQFCTTHPVTQWKSCTCAVGGRLNRSSHVSVSGFSTSPSTVSFQVAGLKLGMGATV